MRDEARETYDRHREIHIITEALRDLTGENSWASEPTKEYIRTRIMPNVWRDWKPKESE